MQQIDRQIVDLLGERAGMAREVRDRAAARGRVATSLDSAARAKALDRLTKRNKERFPEEVLRHVFTEILSACQSLEQPPSVAFLGPEATYTHMATHEFFGASAQAAPYKSVDDVFVACEKGWTDFGVVPIENSAGGVVHGTLDRFIDSELMISGEVTLAIHHMLLANCELSAVTDVYSHPQPFVQCREWLKDNLPSVNHHEVDSTSEGARLASHTPNAAAISSEPAGQMYGVNILVRGIEDVKDNITRFWVIGRDDADPTGNDKTSLMFSVKDRPGALFDLLEPFRKRSINMTKIESRPTRRRAWEYVFFVDCLGHRTDPEIAAAVREMEEHSEFLKIMGSYPCDDRVH